MTEKVNEKSLRDSVIQACEDIKANIDGILDGVFSVNHLNITIMIEDGMMPRIHIDGDYTKLVKVAD